MKFEDLINYFMTAVLVLCVFIIVYFPFEYLITEVWLITPKISPLVTSLCLLSLVMVFSLFNWRIFKERKMAKFLLLFIVFISLFVYREYREQKLIQEKLPKIYFVSPPSWGIQDRKVEIRGRNFFSSHQRGRVFVNEEEFIVEEWKDNYILAKQQVPTEFGEFRLYLIREDGMVSNSIPFEIRNPDELKDFQ